MINQLQRNIPFNVSVGVHFPDLFGQRAKMIVDAWVNDRDTLRKAGASSDPYAVFARMLGSGNPPDDWPALMAAAQMPDAVKRFATSETTGSATQEAAGETS